VSDTVHDCAGYPLHSPFSPSLLHPCVSVCHQIPFLLYHRGFLFQYTTIVLMQMQMVKTFFFLWRCGPTLAMASSFLRFLDHTQRRITVRRTCDQPVYLTTLNTNRHPCPGEIRTHNPSKRAAVEPRLTPRDH